jgi:ABC-type lipoprotein export system ATPase subunit
MDILLTAHNLHKNYGAHQAVRGVSLTLESGRMLALMGPSGCGKSSLLLVLGLLQPPDGGEYTSKGQNLLALDHRQQALFRRTFFGFVMQSCAVFSYSTVEENLEFPLMYAGMPRKERQLRIAELLDSVNLSDKAQARSNLLSGGEQQRVAAARALVNRPKVLLADEPTGQLDSENTKRLMNYFRRACSEMALGAVIVTHDPAVADYCDVVYCLKDGQVVN